MTAEMPGMVVSLQLFLCATYLALRFKSYPGFCYTE